MSDWTYRGAPHLISPMSPESIGPELAAAGAAAASSQTWPTANKAFYVPVYLTIPIVVGRLWVLNGATAGNSWDVGIYTNAGGRIVSTGSTLQAGTSVIQSVAIAATALEKGNYYLAMSMNGTTGTVFRTNPAAGLVRAMGCLVQTNAFALPATATAAVADAAHIPIFGLAVRGLV